MYTSATTALEEWLSIIAREAEKVFTNESKRSVDPSAALESF